jgi:hypothetical protein
MASHHKAAAASRRGAIPQLAVPTDMQSPSIAAPVDRPLSDADTGT